MARCPLNGVGGAGLAVESHMPMPPADARTTNTRAATAAMIPAGLRMVGCAGRLTGAGTLLSVLPGLDTTAVITPYAFVTRRD